MFISQLPCHRALQLSTHSCDCALTEDACLQPVSWLLHTLPESPSTAFAHLHQCLSLIDLTPTLTLPPALYTGLPLMFWGETSFLYRDILLECTSMCGNYLDQPRVCLLPACPRCYQSKEDESCAFISKSRGNYLTISCIILKSWNLFDNYLTYSYLFVLNCSWFCTWLFDFFRALTYLTYLYLFAVYLK